MSADSDSKKSNASITNEETKALHSCEVAGVPKWPSLRKPDSWKKPRKDKCLTFARLSPNPFFFTSTADIREEIAEIKAEAGISDPKHARQQPFEGQTQQSLLQIRFIKETQLRQTETIELITTHYARIARDINEEVEAAGQAVNDRYLRGDVIKRLSGLLGFRALIDCGRKKLQELYEAERNGSTSAEGPAFADILCGF
ncbi:hypothetical protein EX30DRAFT_375634 [Ascodesmis nigricans]|uniref:Uncharacterized protein n=1 Tax=Ascodesmis nigricans TaxID=341454 RepID=A0A4S2MP30_9PEZI|nr:hypothetical protein EX30DRAFT_375634 [Ascodesmis nigricans]